MDIKHKYCAYCAYRDCITHTSFKHIKKFSFPVKLKERCKQWIQNSGNNLYHVPTNILSHYFICANHFSDDSFTNSERKKINRNAVPIPYESRKSTTGTSTSPKKFKVCTNDDFLQSSFSETGPSTEQKKMYQIEENIKEEVKESDLHQDVEINDNFSIKEMYQIKEENIKEEVEESDLHQDIEINDNFSIKEEILPVKVENLTDTEDISEQMISDDQKDNLDIKIEPSECYSPLPEIEFVNIEGNDTKLELTDRSKTKLQTYECDQCEYKTEYKSSLLTHKLKHSNDKTYKCQDCDYSTSSKCNYKRHQQVKHTEERPFKCDKCEYSTNRRGYLASHELTHNIDLLFKCDQCEYKTSKKGNLQTHKLKHSDILHFKCKQCDYGTYIKDNFKKHTLTHTGQRPYKCDQCEYNCIEQRSLRNHKLKHTGEQRKQLYICNQCDYSDINKYRLRKHKLIHTSKHLYKCDRSEYSREATSFKKHQFIHLGFS